MSEAKAGETGWSLLGRAVAKERLDVGMAIDVLHNFHNGELRVVRGDPERERMFSSIEVRPPKRA
jgi:hypothetical protein